MIMVLQQNKKRVRFNLEFIILGQILQIIKL